VPDREPPGAGRNAIRHPQKIWPMAVELIVAGPIVVLVALLTCLAWGIRGRRQPPASITEAQARENAAPLTTAILATARRERTRV
jgi:hypothetical protein